MKFRFKVLLINIIIIAITLSVSGFFLMSRQNRHLMDEQIKNAVIENNLAESAIEYALLDIINDPAILIQTQLPIISERTSLGLLSSSTDLFITYDGKFIFPSKTDDITVPDQLLASTTDARKNYQIVESDEKTYIYVDTTVKVGDSLIGILTRHDITDTRKIMNDSIKVFELFTISILVISGVIVYVLTVFLTRPLEKLNKITDDFAEGNFDTRSNLRSHDEVGLLSDKFNHMADSVQDHIDELNDMIHRRDQFVADFTHEIKTPMTTIIGYADTLRSVELPREDEIKSASYIFSEGKRLEQMSSHLFDLIYLKDGEIPKNPLNTQALGITVIDTVLPAIETCSIELKYDFENATILADSSLLKTAFINLLDNARKASSKGSVIEFTGKVRGELYEFVVEDHGIGIAQEDIDKICDEFFMVDKSRSRSEGGAGLGMSLVAAILKRHEATLNIESELGKGTRMIVTIKTVANEDEVFHEE